MIIIFSPMLKPKNKDEKLNVQSVEIFKDTPVWDLTIALENHKFELATELISKSNLDLVNFLDPYFGTTLLMRAISTENYDAVELLLKNGAKPNIISKGGETALFRAIFYSWYDNDFNQDPKYVKIMLKFGADPNLLYCAPKEEGVIDPIECGTSPLIQAVSNGIEKVKLLVEAGADINYKTKTGKTAAIKALTRIKVEIAAYLIVENKAKVSDPYFYYNFPERSEVDYKKPFFPINSLEKWFFELDSKEHRMKMDIVEEFKRQGQDYWSIEKHPKTIERIKKIYPNSWQEYLDRY